MEIEVAIPAPLPRTYTYTSDTEVAAGSRVLVPFGPRRVVGVAMGPAEPGAGKGLKLRAISDVVDESPVYSPVMLKIARWLSQYYMYPIGEVVRTMLPASSTRKVEERVKITGRGQGVIATATDADPLKQLLSHLFARKSELKRASVSAKLAKAQKSNDQWQDWTLKRLAKDGYVSLSRGSSSMAARKIKEGDQDGKFVVAQDKFHAMTARQQAVFAEIAAKGLQGADRRPFALLGVTGSGKTEVYLNLIRSVLENEPGGQCLVMVPEISLTPQMTRVFSERFPDTVAVVHSAMTDVERWAELSRIRSGQARILIGPRSAVFGPFADLRLILVDEEHDSSYKQSTGLTYNGRDTAVLRATWEDATIVLGSATLSMETYYNAVSGKYHLLEMPERVTGRALPDIKILAKSPKANRVGESLSVGVPTDFQESAVEPEIINELQANHEVGQQSIVLVNRRGYAYYLFSLEEKEAVQCPQCSISLTLHNRHELLRCHYCDYSQKVSQLMLDRGEETFVAVGYGSQKAETHLASVLPKANIVRLDSDTVTKKDYLPNTLNAFRKGEIDVLVGTQILAKGHDFPGVTLICILEVDQLLNLPDFRAGERTFQLIVQAAGRAGRAELAGRVLIQTVRPNHPVIGFATTQDYKAFADRELTFRRDHGYPPFSRMVAIELNSPDRGALGQIADKIDQWIDAMMTKFPDLFTDVSVLGPAIPSIEQIRGRHRRTLVISSPDPRKMHHLSYAFQEAFPVAKLPGDVRIRYDVDPQSLI